MARASRDGGAGSLLASHHPRARTESFLPSLGGADAAPGNSLGGDRASLFVIAQVVVLVAALVARLAIGHGGLALFAVSVVAGSALLVLYRGASKTPMRVTMLAMTVLFVGGEVSTWVGLGEGGACGGDGGFPNALAGSQAAAFCNHGPETRWAAGMLGAFVILGVGTG